MRQHAVVFIRENLSAITTAEAIAMKMTVEMTIAVTIAVTMG